MSAPVTEGAASAPEPWSVDRVTAILDLVRDGVLVVSADDVIQYVNPVAAERLGGPPAGIVGARLGDLLAGLERTAVPAALADLRRTGGEVEVEEYVPVLHGWFHMVASTAGGEITIFVREVTGRLRAERHAQLVARIDDAIADTSTFTKALAATLHAVRAELGFEYADAWMRSPDGRIRLVAVDHDDPSPELATFASTTRATDLPAGSLVARVFEADDVVAHGDLTSDESFDRSDALRATELRTGMFAPVDLDRNGEMVIGLLRQAPLDVDDADAVFGGVRPHVSSALSRRQAQLEVEQFFLLSREYVAVTGLDGRYRRLNPAMVNGLGFREEAELLAIEAIELVHPDDRERTLAILTRARLVKQPVDRFENRVRTADGRYRWISWTAQPSDDDSVIFAAGRDVTDEREQRLFRDGQNDVLRGIVTGDPIRTTLTRLVELIDDEDQRAGCVMALRPADGHGDDGTPRLVDQLELVASHSVPDAFAADLRQTMAGPDGGRDSFAVPEGRVPVIVHDLAADDRSDQHLRTALDHGFASCWTVPIPGSDDRVLGTVTCYSATVGGPTVRQLERVNDVARLAGVAVEHRRSADSLTESEARLRLLAEVVTDGVFEWDPATGRWTTTAFAELFGHDVAEQCSDAWWTEHLHPDDRERVVGERDRALAGDVDLWSSEHRVVRADGTPADVAVRGRIVRDEHGAVTGIVGGISDVTERRDLERQYLRAQRVESLGTLAGGIAHDLNNSLMPILMATELLEADDLGDEARENVEVIALSARRSAEMVRSILTYARGADASPTVRDVAEIVRTAVRMLRDTFPKDIRIVVPEPPTGIRVRGDATQLHQVVVNFALNARDAMPDGGTLTISVDEVDIAPGSPADGDGRVVELTPGRYARLRVGDTGTGITTAVRDRLFEPFFTTKPRAGGTGLGLPTALAIARSHGGGLAVTSEVGVGSTFDLLLPMLTDRPAVDESEPAAGRSGTPSGDGAVVLVVDDEAIVRSVVTDVLESAGYQVVEAPNGAVALRSLTRAPRPAVVVTDLMMPVMDGFEMVERLRNSGDGVPVIAMTGVADDRRIDALRQHGVVRVLAKPFDRSRLLDAVADVLSGR